MKDQQKGSGKWHCGAIYWFVCNGGGMVQALACFHGMIE